MDDMLAACVPGAAGWRAVDWTAPPRFDNAVVGLPPLW